LRERGASEEQESAWARHAFTWDPSMRELMIHRARNVKARVRYWWWRRRHASA
jgi:hypothetical protein